MDDSTLERAALALRQQLVSPLRIEGTDLIHPRGVALILDAGGRRQRLVVDVDPAHATFHLEPVPRRDEWRPVFGQKLRGGFLVDARPVPGDRRVELDIAFRTIEPSWRIHVAWHGRGGNAWIVDLAGGVSPAEEGDSGATVLESLQDGEEWRGASWRAPDPDRRPRIGDATPGDLAEALLEVPVVRWTREIPRRFRAVSRPTVWQALQDVLGGAEPSRDRTRIAIAGRLHARLAELAQAPPGVGHSYRLPPETSLEVPIFDEGVVLDGGVTVDEDAAPGGTVREEGTALDEAPSLHDNAPSARDLGLPSAWVSLAPLPAFSSFEVDLPDPSNLDSASDRGEGRTRNLDGGRLFWLLARTHRTLLRETADGARRARVLRRLASDSKRIDGIGKRLLSELSVDEGPKLRLWGEAILAHLREIRRGDEALVCPDLRNPEGPALHIPLDPARPATEVADGYFKQARRWDKGRPRRETRLGHVVRALEALESLQRELRESDELPSDEAIEARIRQCEGPFYKPGARGSEIGGRSGEAGGARRDGGAKRDGGTASGSRRASGPRGARAGSARDADGSEGGRRRSAEGASPSAAASGRRSGAGSLRPGPGRFRPRTYQTSDGWTVIVGRSNEENDYVSMKLAKQDDYWFHAHGVPGSHVLLRREGRKDNPSRKTIEEAAAIAAYFSKARNSSRAPVIYTLAKYVSKPRKAKPGLVTCTRETSILVRPYNPEPDAPPEWED